MYCFVASGLLYSSIKDKKKVATSDMKLATTKSALLIFPAGCPASIFSANELNYRVRDGNGWTLKVINTDYAVMVCTTDFRKMTCWNLKVNVVTRRRIELLFSP